MNTVTSPTNKEQMDLIFQNFTSKPVTLTNLRGAVYGRVTTEHESQDTSIPNQLEIYETYAKAHGWTITHTYTDRKSGTKLNRPGLKKLIEDAQNKAFDVIITKELSRLARNGKLSYELRDICINNGIHIVCLDGSINTLEGKSEYFGMFAWLYELEAKNASRRNKEAIKAKINRQEYIGSTAPYGYTVKDKKLIIRDDNSPLVIKQIFQDYLSGVGLDSIAISLTNKNVPTPSQLLNKRNASPVWHSSSIKGILINPHYIGHLVQGREETVDVTSYKRNKKEQHQITIHENVHEPIIDTNTFIQVQNLMASKYKGRTKRKAHLFTNTLFCSHCGRGLWYKNNQRGYRCGGNSKHGDTLCSNRFVIREVELEKVILEEIHHLLKIHYNQRWIEEFVKTQENKTGTNESQLNAIQIQIEKLLNQKVKYIDLLMDGKISEEELQHCRNSVDKKLSALHDLEVKLVQDMNNHQSIDVNLLIKELDLLMTLSKLPNELLHSLIEKITCSSDGEVTIHYQFKKQ